MGWDVGDECWTTTPAKSTFQLCFVQCSVGRLLNPALARFHLQGPRLDSVYLVTLVVLSCYFTYMTCLFTNNLAGT